MRIVLAGDFNLDQMLEANVEKIDRLKSEFNFNDHSYFTTQIFYIWGGMEGGGWVIWSNIFHYVDLINILDSSTPPQ